jgi:hypothetical protein
MAARIASRVETNTQSASSPLSLEERPASGLDDLARDVREFGGKRCGRLVAPFLSKERVAADVR